jgi:imidazolonepropionase-like amidohydrolase
VTEFNTKWAADKLRAKAEREQRQLARTMASPVARGEVARLGEIQLQHIASLALAIEALDVLLVEKGLFADNEIMDRMRQLAEQKADVAIATDATEGTMIAETRLS